MANIFASQFLKTINIYRTMDGYYSDNEINDDKSPIEEEDGILNNDKVIHFHENFEYFTSDKNWGFFISDVG